MHVDFYHLTTSAIEQVLARVAERVLAESGRLLIVSNDERQRDLLDRHLWTYKSISFLPHARAGTGDDAEQPVLIANEVSIANGAKNIALADGIWRDEALGFDRVFNFFDEAVIDTARKAWRGLANRRDVERRYWKQAENGWEQVA